MLGRKFDQSIKTIIVGDSGVGKTCILIRFIRDDFERDNPSTLGVQFMSKTIEMDNHIIELQLWDTAGQELFRAVTRGYFRSSAGAFICFDITDHHSFDNVNNWLNDIRDLARKDCVCVLLGNKSDLEAERKVSTEEAQAYADAHNLKYFECSALSGQNVQKAVTYCLEEIEKLIEQGQYQAQVPDNIVFSDEASSKNSSCC